MKKKLFVLLLFLSISTIYVFSSEFIDGIWYNLDYSSQTATVTSSSYYMSYYSGSVVIPSTITYNGKTYNVKSIGEQAFDGCSDLTSVTIPDCVTYIGNIAFRNCTSLTSVHIYDIEAWCNISFSDNLSNPLYYAHNLYLNEELITDLAIPNSITYIKDNAFCGCSCMTSVTIPNSVIYIGNSAFSGCSNLTLIEIPHSVIYIGDYAFKECTSLNSIDISNSIESIGDCTFQNCSSLISIYIPSSVEYIGDSAFEGCSSLTSIDISNSIIWNIGDRTFQNCSSLTSIDIPNSVERIGESAFSGCKNLSSIIIGNSVIGIRDSTFKNCTNLTSITIPNSVSWIQKGVFCGCDSLSSVTINSNNIMSNSYSYTSNIRHIFGNQVKEYILGDNVTSIGSRAFYMCDLTSVTIPKSVTSIGTEAFYCPSDFTEVHIADIAAWCAISFADYSSNPLSQANNLYLNNEIVTDLVIPDGVTRIEKYAFNFCTCLISVTVPNSVESIGSHAFYRCINLTSINVDDNNPNYCSLDGVLFNKDKSNLIQYPGGKQGEYTIPDGVTRIREEAFYYCSGLTSIKIPNSVTHIESHAFYDCTGLTSITCYAVTPPDLHYEGVFDNHSIPLYVPWESIYLYKKYEYEWQFFKNIYAIEDEDPMAADAINENQKHSSKLIRNGSVYILTDDSRIYTLTGQEVK